MHYPKVTIGVILYKVNPHLRDSLTSLIEQDYPNIEYLFRDQSPKGEAYDYIEKKLPEVFDKVYLEKGENLWHSGGHNALIRKMTGEYYICASNDMLYPPDMVTNFVKELEKKEYQPYGSATCKLMSWDFVLRSQEYPEIDKTNIIDSCGIGIKKSHFFYDIGQGEDDDRQYDHKKYIFGASGALAVYRKEALENVAFDAHSSELKALSFKEYFDELLHYKNDVDLAYRLQWAGWPCLFLPEIKVYHDRQAKNQESGNPVSRILKARKSKDKWVKENSFFGQQVTVFKNFTKDYSFTVKLMTYVYKWSTILFALTFERYLLKELKKFRKLRKDLTKKRDALKRNVSAGMIERFMN